MKCGLLNRTFEVAVKIVQKYLFQNGFLFFFMLIHLMNNLATSEELFLCVFSVCHQYGHV